MELELTTKRFEDVDYFTDRSLPDEPHSYFEFLRAQGPLTRLPLRGVVAVTGYNEGNAIFRNEERFSSYNAAYGPNPLPFTPEGEDITDQIESHRDGNMIFRMISTFDPPNHTRLRMLLRGLFSPKRLVENEKFMRRLADGLIDEFIANGTVEIVSQFALPFATLVIADLLGVPEEDHKLFRRIFSASGMRTGSLDGVPKQEDNPMPKIEGHFIGYIEDRRSNPRNDVLTDLANTRYPDGSLPPVKDVAALSAFLFAAGQEATVRVAAAMFHILAEDQALQARLREERSLIPNFAEETLRLESAVKSGFRLAKVRATIGDVEIEAGTPLMMCIAAMNRDPAKFEDPNAFKLDRKNARDHVAFGRGIHSCIGAPLARIELKVTVERMFDRIADIRIDDAKHGPVGNRTYRYAPSYIVRGLTELHLAFTPAS
ncbi:Cytochrome P450 [Novosphingobium sp. CF614]|uniref:cytochrome P450 n=1 Tax=Novosphingobium sp. CF614 TaxID=1884364 RepID=UPI0008E7A1F9|nr:cytochrome P450 [Novosphingobium sp. CF614]SFF82962.1 Cytochrome P450 [Novosphingobium sp. CF614]